jgi:hypothetical protein
VLVDRLLVERIDFGRRGDATGGADLPGPTLEPRPAATGEEDVRPFAGEDRATAPPIEPPPP